MTRQEILGELKCDDSGFFSDVLSDLCNCGFVRKYSAFGKIERSMMYQLTDLYTLFYLRFVKSYNGEDSHYWSHRQMDISPWEGYAFEQICLHHIPQIRRKLGITGVLTNVCSLSWDSFVDKTGMPHRGGQVDLVIDHGDKTINLCEMKYTSGRFSISSDYARRMAERREAFVALTGTRKSVHLTMVTADGIELNAGAMDIQSNVVLDDLFKEDDE